MTDSKFLGWHRRDQVEKLVMLLDQIIIIRKTLDLRVGEAQTKCGLMRFDS